LGESEAEITQRRGGNGTEIEWVRWTFSEVLNVERVGRKSTRVIEKNGGEARGGPGAPSESEPMQPT